ncbi:MAG: DUF1232 domain-containing protein [Candidatus Eremiobacteraeota bacterium]|nr:DUF1232 domain-containing protein [Candidatus Eremiobacteraeota bacterium]MBV8374125.1 DUF1232 domain-containing protein [Candidatus Eremiobacteraeota bacterium]
MRLLRLLFAAKTALFRTVPLLRDARVPLSLKLIVAAIGLLVISPIDLFGDVPVLGALDDAALLTLLCMWFVSQAARYVDPVPVRRRPGSALAAR